MLFMCLMLQLRSGDVRQAIRMHHDPLAIGGYNQNHAPHTFCVRILRWNVN